MTLGGSITSTAFDLGDVGDEDSLSVSLGPLISWSFPNQTAARARLRQAEAGAQIALAGFDQTVLEALQETETALTVFAAERQRRASLEVARDAAAEAARLARIRYQPDRKAISRCSMQSAPSPMRKRRLPVPMRRRRVPKWTFFMALGVAGLIPATNRLLVHETC